MHLVFTTFADSETAGRIVRTLLEERLIACGTLTPGVQSVYRWEGKIEDAAEVLVLLKTACVEQLLPRLQALHPYSNPEVLAITVDRAAEPYLAWVVDSCANKEGSASR